MRATAWTVLLVLALTFTIVPSASARTCIEGTATVCVGSYREDVCRFSGATLAAEGIAVEGGAFRCGGPEGLYATAGSSELGSLVEASWGGDGSCVLYANAGGVHEAVPGTPCPEAVVTFLALLG